MKSENAKVAARATTGDVAVLKPNTYQPTRQELKADVGIPTSPEQLVKAVVQPVVINPQT